MAVHGEVGNGLFGKRSLEFGHHAPTGHRLSAQGANLGNPPGRRDPRSEGTPYSRGSALKGSVFFLGLSLWLTRFPDAGAAAGEGHADHEQRRWQPRSGFGDGHGGGDPAVKSAGIGETCQIRIRKIGDIVLVFDAERRDAAQESLAVSGHKEPAAAVPWG